MSISLNPPPKFFLIDNNGDPAVGWKIHTYEAGTLIDKPTYTNQTGGVANTNPVILDARGEADIWWNGTYKVVVKDENDVTIYTVDNYTFLSSGDVVGSYDDIATLKAIIAAPSVTSVRIKGYRNDGDGGEGDFYWDAASAEAEDGGTIFKADAIATGRWKRAGIYAFKGLNALWFGILFDGDGDDDGAITAADNTFTSAASPFVPGDVGKSIVIIGAGAAGETLSTTIASYTSAGEVELTDAAGTTVSGEIFYFGTDNTTELQGFLDAIGDGGSGYSPKGAALYSTLEMYSNRITIEGDGDPNRTDIKNGIFSIGSMWLSTSTAAPALTYSNGVFQKRYKTFRNIGFIGATDTDVWLVDNSMSSKTLYASCSIGHLGKGNGLKLEDAWIFWFRESFMYKEGSNVRTGKATSITNTGLGGLYNFIGSTIYQWATAGLIGEETITPAGGVENVNFLNGSQLKSNSTGFEIMGGVKSFTCRDSYLEGQTVRSARVRYGAQNITFDTNFINDSGAGVESLQFGGNTADEKQWKGARVINNNITNINATGTGIKVLADTTTAPESLLIQTNTLDGSGTGIDLGGQAGVAEIGINSYGSSLATDVNNKEKAAILNYNNSVRHYTHHPAQEPNVEVISATKTLTKTDSLVQFLDGGLSDHSCRLPPEADSYGREYIIKNIGGTNNIEIKADSGATVYATLTPGQTVRIMCDASSGAWQVI